MKWDDHGNLFLQCWWLLMRICRCCCCYAYKPSHDQLSSTTDTDTRLIWPSSWWWWWQVVRKRRSYHCHFRVLSPAEATRVDLISKIAILSFWSDLNVSTHMVKGKGGAAVAEEASLFPPPRPPPNCFPLSIRPLLILSLFSFFSGHCWVRSLASSSSSSNRSTLLSVPMHTLNSRGL